MEARCAGDGGAGLRPLRPHTLKAIAFIRLRLGETDEAARRLATLRDLGAIEGLGGGVVEDLMRAVA